MINHFGVIMHLLFLFSFILLNNVAVENGEWEGWVPQSSGTTTTLRSVHFINVNTGWAVGGSGTILKTTNAGANWVPQNSGTNEQLYTVNFIDENTGWAAGLSGTILSTNNGGATWTAQTSGITVDFLSIYFIDNDTGWVVGGDGTILKTTNGGIDWVAQTSGSTTFLRSIHFIDGNTGWVVGTGGTILKTTNGGTDWAAQSIISNVTLGSVYFIDGNTGWVVGSFGTILKTTNGGANWVAQSSGSTTTLASVHFIDGNTGWVVGNSGMILSTKDGGSTWMTQNSSTNSSLTSVHFINENTGWAVGTGGSIIKSGIITLNLETPNGGEIWLAGTQKNITWSSENISNVRLQYSIDNGLSWLFINSSVSAASGSFIWTVPNTLSSQAKVRILNTIDATHADTSEGTFHIVSLSIINPGSAVDWAAGSTQNIEWVSDGITDVSLDYTHNDGETWTVIAENISANLSHYEWVLPQISTNQARIRIRDANLSEVNVQSGIIRIFNLILNSPNGDEIWQAGTQKNIEWTSENITNVRLQYSTDDGSNWLNINSFVDAASGSFTWTIPNTPSNQTRVRINNTSRNAQADTSNGVFSIVSLNVTNPKSAVNWAAGSTQNIEWTSDGILNVSIDYTLNDGESWINIVEDVPADSSNYEWVVPLTFSTQSRIRIRDVEDPEINSHSPIFTISTLALTSPTGGEFWKIGTGKNITWNSDGISQLRLQYSTNNGSTWNLITSFTPAENGSYSWTVPNAPSSQARIRINSTANVTQADSSAETFNIYSLSLNSPNGGQLWTGGSEQSIHWSASGVDKLKLEYSLDNGETWSLIADSVEVMPSNYTWTVPNIPTNQAKVRVSIMENPDIYEESNSPFTIRRYAALYPDTVIVQQPSYINVMFHALDQNGIGVDNLTDDEFKIEENNTVISESESFKQVGKADQLSQTMKTVLILDNSFSLTPEEIIIIKEAAVAFVQNKLPEQLISVYEFSENVNLLQDFTTDTTALINAINGIERGFPSTNLYGAIITGLSRWNDTYSLTHVEQGTLVVFTDGDDTQASATLSQVMAARGSKRVITVGLGSDIDSTILQNIGNAGFYQATDANELTEQFLIIQENLIKFTQSFYWLNYVSPKRGDNNHQLRLSLHENQNFTGTASFTIPFNSNGFYSLVFGIAINPEPLNPFGVDTVNVKANIPEIITIQVPFSFTIPEISIQGADAESVTIEKIEDEQNKFSIKATGAPGESKNIKIVEAKNDYSKDLVLMLSNQNPPSKIVLSEPADSISIPETTIQFKWNSDPNMSDNYTFQLSNISSFENIITDSTVVDTLILQDNLNLNEIYYWRVMGHNDLGDGEWSDVWTFSTFESVLAPVNLLLPENEETGVSLTPDFKWSSTANAQTYRFQLALSADFASVSMDSSGISDTLFHYSEELQHSTIYYWRVKAVNEEGESNWSEVYSFESLIVTTLVREDLPVRYELVQNYPNPFNPSTNIRYGIPNSAHVRLEVYNIIGQRVTLLVNEQKNAGWHNVNFDATKLSSGLYFYRIQSENFNDVKKMMLIK